MTLHRTHNSREVFSAPSGGGDLAGLPDRFADHPATAVRPFAFVCPRKAKIQYLLIWAALSVLFVLLLPQFSFSAEHGDSIINRAWLESEGEVAASSSVSVKYAVRTPSQLTFLKYAPTSTEAETMTVTQTSFRPEETAADTFEDMPAPRQVPSGSPIDIAQEIPLAQSAVFHRGEPVFLRLYDPDQNLDFDTAETVLITLSVATTGDTEILRLTETGPSTGVFTGYIQSSSEAATTYNGRLEVNEAGTVEARYVDFFDGVDTSVAATLFDPFGVVFDSRSGLPVNGAEITLVDADTGLPATVYGDNGVSLYPATVTSGGTATDSDGNIYDFQPGDYRFPFVAPGNYRLVVTPPSGYAAPSTVSDADLQDLPGAPYVLAAGSRGELFRLDPGPALRIDLPVDPVVTGSVWLRKTAGKSRVAPGDFLPYRVEIENPNEGPVEEIILTDRLPVGFRYRPGSAHLDGERADDPRIADDGRTLTFSLAQVAAQTRQELRYVVEVTAGARRGEAVNTVEAVTGSGAVSNMAEAEVTVGEDFFRSTAFLMGRVFTGGCGEPSPDEPDGLPGARIYLEDGTFVLTDENGMFHFEGIRPGVHAVQLDLDSLPEWYEAVPCEPNSRFAGRAFSQFVDLQGGSMWRTDFHVVLKPRPRGEVSIEMNGALNKNIAQFHVPIEVGAVDLRNLRLSVTLPEGVQYLEGSATMDEASVEEPAVDAKGLTFSLGDADAGQATTLTFRCRIVGEKAGELPAAAVLIFDAPAGSDLSTPPAENLLLREFTSTRVSMPEFTVRPHFPSLGAELSESDKAELDQLAEKLRKLNVIRLYAVGHTDNVRIARRNRHLFADNFALSEARAKSVGRYLGEALSLPPAKIVLSGLGDSVPVADNTTPAGRALNRRVEVRVLSEKVTDKNDLRLVNARSGRKKIETEGLRPGEFWAEEKQADEATSAKPEPGLLSPSDGSVLAGRIAAVRVRLDGRLKPRLSLDGKEIPADRIGFTMEDKESGLNLYSYIGVDFGDPGEHVLKIEGIGPFGNARFEQTATVTRSGEIALIKLLESDGNVADGLTPVTLQVALVDEAGKVMRAPAQLEIRGGTLRPPEDRKAVENEVEDLKNPDKILDRTVTVDSNGYVRFAPVQSGGLYTVLLGHGDRTLEVETYIQPKLRDWILVGLAEGTVGYNRVSGNMENLPGGVDEDLYEDGRVAFFGKGRVLGKWLLTLAYDSDKPDRKDKELFQIIDPDAYYTLYGDASQQAYDAASAEKLFVKLEREQFYALFGDYTTGLSKTELSRYSRSLMGFKSEYNGRYATFNAFASDTDQGFVKDELRGDGTSGLYRLSRNDIVLNSEKVTIEVRDRLRSEVIVSSQELSRHVDYNIDYQQGTIFFKEPIPSQDTSFNPIYIVVDYETNGSEDTSFNYGGRGALRWPDKRVEIGASAIHEEQDNAEGDLYGLDATWEITEETRLKAEIADSESAAPGESRKGNAWLAEVEHIAPEIAGRVYIREMENGFGLGQQRGSEEGTRKYGAEGVYKLNTALNLGGTVYRQVNLETDAVRDVAQADLTYQAKRYSLTTGLRHATDKYKDGVTERSTQALLGGTWQVTDRLLLRFAREQSIFGNNESADFPTRTTLGADYRITESTTLFAAQEFTDGDDTKSESTRVGFRTTPWTGGSVDTSLEQQTGEYGPRMFALFGLGQTLQLSERWSIDAGLDRNQTVREPDARNFDTDVPPASGGTEDFTAISLGATYQLEKWSWANRIEYRTGDTEERWGLFSAVVGEVNEGLGLSARVQLFTTDAATLERTDGEVRFGLAYRPLYTRWIVLNRLDFRFEQETSETFDYDNWRLINNFNANYKPNRRTQISLQYGAKYVKENIDGDSYAGFTDLIGAEGRYDLDERWDIGLRGSLLHSWHGGQFDFSSGASVGCHVLPNAWLSLGYNFLGFEDEDFSRADFTAAGPFVTFRFKFDQQSMSEAARQLSRL